MRSNLCFCCTLTDNRPNCRLPKCNRK